MKELKYLGHVVSDQGITPNPERIEAIVNMPTPTNAKQVNTFKGMVNFYSEFVKDFSILMTPLYELINAAPKDFKWNKEAQESFKKLKDVIVSAPLLVHPNFEFPFILQTDACEYGIGAVLSQRINKKDGVVSYLSRRLTPNEKKWSIREKEALAIIWACEKCRPFLIGKRFIIETDHHSLQWLMKAKGPARLVRWALRLSEYDFEIKYKKAELNSNADGLSRLLIEKPADESEETEELQNEEAFHHLNVLQEKPVECEEPVDYDQTEMKFSQQNDPDLQPLIKTCERNNGRSDDGQYALCDGLLYLLETNHKLLLVPSDQITKLLHLYHNSDLSVHVGLTRLHKLFKKRFFWNGMYRDIQNWVSACLTCSTTKPNQPLQNGVLRPIKTSQPFDIIGMDIVGPLHRTSNNNLYILTFIDLFSGWVEATPIRNITAATIERQFFKLIITRHGCPRKVITDQGTQFMSRLFKTMCLKFNIEHVPTTAYHQQGNGKCEKFHKFLITALATVINQKQTNWDVLLDNCLMIYRMTVSRAINESPFFVIYGRDPTLPQDLLTNLKPHRKPSGNEVSEEESYMNYKVDTLKQLKSVYEKLLNHKNDYMRKFKEYYDRMHKETQFKEGDLVMILYETPKKGLTLKFLPRWHGPFKILKKIDDVTFRVESEDQTKIIAVHVQRIRLYRPWIEKKDNPGPNHEV